MFYLILISIIWAISFSLIKGELTSIDPNIVAFLRLIISFIIFVPFLKLRNIKKSNFFHLILIGSLQYGLMYSTYIYSFQYLKAYEIALMTIFTPIFVVLFNDLWNKKVIYRNWTKALLAVIGSAIILYDDNLTIGFWKGIILIQVSNILFAIGQVYYKSKFDKNGIANHSSHFAILFAGGAIVTGIFSLGLANINEINIGLNQWLVILYLGVVASGIGFFLWNYGITKVNIGKVAIFNNLKIPLGVFFAMIILGESANYLQLIVGSLVLLVAIFIDKISRRLLRL